MIKKITIATFSQPTLTPVFFVVLLALVSVYMYYVSVSVVHVVMRKEAVHNRSLLVSEIALLETQYINARHAISERLADLDGYGDIEKKVFLSRSNENLVVFERGSQ
jgi:hypothetical protein